MSVYTTEEIQRAMQLREQQRKERLEEPPSAPTAPVMPPRATPPATGRFSRDEIAKAVEIRADEKATQQRAQADASSQRILSDLTPEMVAKVRQLSRDKGISIPLAKDVVRRTLQREEGNAFRRTLRDNPGLNTLSTQQAFADFRDDASSLEIVEMAGQAVRDLSDNPSDILRAAGTGVTRFGETVSEGAAEALLVASRYNTRAAEAIVDLLGGDVEEVERTALVAPALEYAAKEVFQDPAQVLEDTAELIGVPPERRNFITDVIEGTGQLAGQVVIGLLTQGRSSVMLAMGGAQAMAEQADMQREAGAYGTPEGDTALLTSAAVLGLLERYNLDQIINKIPAANRGRVTRMFATGVSEGGTEFAQAVSQQLIALGLYDEDALQLDEAAYEGAVGAAVGAIVGAVLPGRTRDGADTSRGIADAVDPVPATQAEQARVALETSRRAIEQSKTFARDPEAIRQLLDEGGEQEVTLPAEAIEALRQDGTLTDADIAQLGFEDELTVQGELSGEVKTTASRLLTLEGEAFAQLARNTRLRPEQPTVVEAEMDLAQREADVERLLAEMEQSEVGEREIRDLERDIATQIVAAGRPRQEARAAAQVTAQRYATLAENYGPEVTARTLYEEDQLRVGASQPQGTLEQAATEVRRTPEFDAFFGDSRVVDAEGQPLVVYHGSTADISEFRTPSFFTTDPSEASGYTFAENLRRRDRLLAQPRYTAIEASGEVGDRLPYVGIPSDVPLDAEGQFWATDNGVVRRLPQGRFEVVTDMVVDYGTADARAETIGVRPGQSVSAQSLIDDERETLDETYPPDVGVGGNVTPVYLSIQNPIQLDALEANRLGARLEVMTPEEVDAFIADLEAQGYDGIQTTSDDLAYSVGGAGPAPEQWIAFRPEQIKSISNRGTFDPGNPNILYQSPVTVREAQEQGVETGTPMPTRLQAAKEFARTNRFTNGRDFKLALQEQAASGLTGLDDATAAKLADFVFEDAMEAVQDNENAIGWYDRAVTAAKAELSQLYPEIAEGGESEFAFIWALAVTSNGLKVDKNFELAANAYEIWKDTGEFPTKIGIGQAAKGINDGLKMYKRLVDKLGGWEAARDFMVQEQTVKQVEAQSSVAISGEGKNEIIRGAGVLGPKIGNGFFSNLYGYFDGLTMDRWLMRSVGRWRGTLIAGNPKMEAQKRDEIKALISDNGSNANGALLDHLIGGLSAAQGEELRTMFPRGFRKRLTNAEVDLIAQRVAKASAKPAWRTVANGLPGGEDLRKLGNALAKYLDGQVEAPAGARERSFIRKVFKDALARLQEQPGMEALTMADLQALLWYPEKLLYDTAKKPAGTEVTSYDDDDAPDYANAARKLVRDRLGRTGGAGDPVGGAGDARRGAEPAPQGQRAGRDSSDGAGRTGSGSLSPLEGAPTVRGVSGPDPQLVAVAEQYAAENGIDLRRQAEFVEVDPERATMIADAYEQMEHNPGDPVVAEAYQNLIEQTIAQYEALVAAGYKFYFIDLDSEDGQAYASSPWNAMFDARNNKTMGVFSTAEGFGTDEDFSPDANPLLAQTEYQWPLGPEGEMRPVYANDLFRAVHDAFGHGMEFAGFRARGEENAWQAHVRLYTGSAVAAITTETRGQNSWLNYGPFGETNRTASVEDTVFADQKTGLLPSFAWEEGRSPDEPSPEEVVLGQSPVIGEPFPASEIQQVVYHRTSAEFDRFNIDPERGEAALFFGPDPDNLQQYHNRKKTGDRIIPAYLDVQNPLMLDEFNLQEMQERWGGGSKEFPFMITEEVANRLRDAGFDAIVSEDIYGDGNVNEIAILNEGQVRSAFTGDQLYQPPAADGGPLGTFTPATEANPENMIALGPEANSTTFIHEASHLFLFQQVSSFYDPRLTDQGRARLERQLQATQRWFGQNGKAAWRDLKKLAKAESKGVSTKTQMQEAVARAEASGDPVAYMERVAATFMDPEAADRDKAAEVAFHELWARGFERYMGSGKAPSSGLREAFATFSSYIVGVYRQLTALNVTLSPEITDVFDRLLASEEAIAAEKDRRSYRIPQEILNTATAAEAARLAELADEAEVQAKTEMQQRVARGLAAEDRAARNARREELTEEIRERVQTEDPAYAALRILREQIDPQGREITPVILDRTEVEAVLTKEWAAAFPVRTMKRNPTGDQKPIPMSDLASLVGLDSARDLGEALAPRGGLPPLEDVVRQQVEQVMLSEFGTELQQDADRQQQAMAAVLNDKFSELQALQTRIMRRLATADLARGAEREVIEEGAGPADQDRERVEDAGVEEQLATETGETDAAVNAAYKRLQAEAKRRAGATQRRAQSASRRQLLATRRGLDIEAINEAADRFVANMKVGDATPNRYRQTSERLTRRIERAIAGRQYDEAARLMEQRALNSAIARRVADVQDDVTKQRKKWRKLTNKADKQLAQTYDIDFINAIRVLLNPVDFAKLPNARNFDAGAALDSLKEQEEALHAELTKALSTFAQRLDGAMEARNGRDAYKDLSVQEFNELIALAENLRANARDNRSMLADGDRVHFTTIAGEIEVEVDQKRRTKRGPLRDEGRGTRSKRGRMQAIGSYLASLRRVELWARAFDNGKFDGPVQRYVVRPVMRAVDEYTTKRREPQERLMELLKDHRDLAKPSEIAAPELDGYKFKSKAELLHFVLHLGNESNKRKLLLGGATDVNSGRQYKFGRKRDDDTVDDSQAQAFLTRMFREEILTKADMDLAQGIWDTFEMTKPAAQAAHKRMYGYNFVEIEAGGISTPFGEYKGGYVPAVSDRMMDPKGARFEAEEVMSQQSSAAMFPGAEAGFTKSRVESNKPLDLDLATLPAHFDRVMKFAYLGPTIRNAARLVTSEDFRAAVGRYDPNAVDYMLIPWLQRTVQQRVAARVPEAGESVIGGALATLQRRVGLHVMTANLVNASQQVTGIATALTRVKLKHLLAAHTDLRQEGGWVWGYISERSPFMAERMQGGTNEAMTTVTQIMANPNALSRTQDFAMRYGYFAQQMTQNMIDPIVWMAAERQANETIVPKIFEETLARTQDEAAARQAAEQAAADFADQVVRDTQSPLRASDISGIEASGPILRLFLQFYSYFNNMGNLLTTEVQIANNSDMGLPARVGRMGYAYLMVVAVPSILAEAIKQAATGGFDVEDEEEAYEVFLQTAVGSQLQTLMLMEPTIGRLASAGYGAAFTDSIYDDRISAAGLGAAESLAATWSRMLGAALDPETDVETSEAIRALISTTGIALGLPVNWLGKPLSYLNKVAEGEADPEGLVDVLQGAITGRDGTER